MWPDATSLRATTGPAPALERSASGSRRWRAASTIHTGRRGRRPGRSRGRGCARCRTGDTRRHGAWWSESSHPENPVLGERRGGLVAPPALLDRPGETSAEHAPSAKVGHELPVGAALEPLLVSAVEVFENRAGGDLHDPGCVSVGGCLGLHGVGRDEGGGCVAHNRSILRRRRVGKYSFRVGGRLFRRAWMPSAQYERVRSWRTPRSARSPKTRHLRAPPRSRSIPSQRTGRARARRAASQGAPTSA
jgi:hypothetical protein